MAEAAEEPVVAEAAEEPVVAEAVEESTEESPEDGDEPEGDETTRGAS